MSQYAEIADLFVHGMPATARGRLSDDELNGAIISASGTADSKIRGRYPLPLIAWGVELTKYVCWIAAYELLSGPRGYNPAAGADINLVDRYSRAIEWLDQVQRQAAHPDITPSAPQVPQYNQPFVISSSVVGLGTGATAARRGW